MSYPVLLRTLGHRELIVAGTAVPLAERETALLAYLCARAGIRIGRAEICRLFWPGKPEAQARHSLSQLLYSVSRKVGRSPIAAQDDTLMLTGVHADFMELFKGSPSRSGSSYRWYGGRFLGASSTRYAVEIEHWSDQVEADVAEVVGGMLFEQAFSCADSQIPEVTRVAREVLAEHPDSRHSQLAILECLARTGEYNEVRRLHERFSRGESARDLPPLESFTDRENLSLQPRVVRLVGRDRELAALQRLWDDALQGQGRVAVIAGESGIGKTRLAEHLLRRVALRNGTTLIARCYAATHKVPYATVTELVEDNFRGEQRAHLLQCVRDAQSAGSADRHALTVALTDAIVTKAAAQPLAILIDDAQWAEEYSALLLAYWSYRLRDHRVLIVLTVRTADTDPVPAWIRSDLTKPSWLTLKPLTAQAACDIVEDFRARSDGSLDRDLCEQAIWRSGGRPFLLLEALQSIAELRTADSTHRLLTESAESSLRRRFHELPADCLLVLHALAVEGRRSDLRALQNVSGLSGEEVAHAVDVLLERGIVTCTAGRVDFVHDLMREVAYTSCPTGTRCYLHRKWAEYEIRTNRNAGHIAHHYLEAGDFRHVSIHAAAAAADAYQTQNFREYEHYVRLCLDHGNRQLRRSLSGQFARYLIQMGRTREIDFLWDHLSGDRESRILRDIMEIERELSGGSRDAINILSLIDRIGDLGSDAHDTSAASVLATILDVCVDAGSAEFGSKVLDRLLRRRKPALTGEAYASALSIAAVWKAVTDGTDTALPLGAEALRSAQRASLPTRSVCLTSYATLLLLAGKVGQAIDHFAAALEAAIQAGDIRRQYAIHINNGIALLEVGSADAAKQSFERALTAPSIRWRVRGYGNLAIWHYEHGDLASAYESAEALLSINSRYRSSVLDDLAHAICGLVELENRHIDAALKRSRSLEVTPHNIHGAGDLAYSVALLARLESEQGSLPNAIALLDATIHRVAPHDALCALRVMLAKVLLISRSDTRGAIALNHDLMRRAAQYGAERIHQSACRIMQQLHSSGAQSVSIR